MLSVRRLGEDRNAHKRRTVAGRKYSTNTPKNVRNGGPWAASVRMLRSGRLSTLGGSMIV
jgi:hypothetical protein